MSPSLCLKSIFLAAVSSVLSLADFSRSCISRKPPRCHRHPRTTIFVVSHNQTDPSCLFSMRERICVNTIHPSTQITDVGIDSFRRTHPKLRVLDVSGCKLITDQSIKLVRPRILTNNASPLI